MTELLGKSEVPELCLTLCDPTDCGLPGSSVHGIFPAIVLEWIAISFSRGSSQPRDPTRVSRIVDRRFTVWATVKLQFSSVQSLSRVQLFATPWIAARQASLSITTLGVHSNSLPSSPWCHPAISSSVVSFSSCPSPSQHQSLFQWVNSSHEVAKVLELQL